MPNPNDFFMRLVAANEQERAECLSWWQDTSLEDKLAVWDMIQRPFSDPIMEIMARFAQLSFAEMAEKHGMGK